MIEAKTQGRSNKKQKYHFMANIVGIRRDNTRILLVIRLKFANFQHLEQQKHENKFHANASSATSDTSEVINLGKSFWPRIFTNPIEARIGEYKNHIN